MRLKVFLFVNLFCFLSLNAQRDFNLVEDRNFWLTSGNAASLTTFYSPSISIGNIYYNYSSGTFQDYLEGKHNNRFGADVRSFTRLSQKLVMYGSVKYDNNLVSDVAGSMLLPCDHLPAFDLVEVDKENSGNKRFEYFNIDGVVGWNVSSKLSVGGHFDFTAGTFSKHRDLRHTNTLMDLDASLSAFWSFRGINGVGISFDYRRRSESIKFETFGTTDKVFKTLVDYANGYGEIETFGGEGFTDSNHETPLFNEFVGLTFTGGLYGIYGEISYRHRTGYYGKKSQYTVSYSNHHGDWWAWKIRYQLPKTSSSLCFFDIFQSIESLSTFRSNYRKETSPENSSVSFYEYYEPTKISYKSFQKGGISFIGYWKPVGEIYLWNVYASIGYNYTKQSAYFYPEVFPGKWFSIIPELKGSRNFIFKDTSLFKVELSYRTQLKYLPRLNPGVKIMYEFPLHNSSIRPSIALSYDYYQGLEDPIKGMVRNSFMAQVGVMF